MTEGAVSIITVGDMVPTRRLLRSSKPVSDSFAEVVGVLHQTDVVFGNLEAAISNRGAPREKLMRFRADPVIAADLREVGFDVISLANNHSMDYGPEAMLDTIQTLEAQGLRCVGAGEGLEQARQAIVITSRGVRIGFLGWSCCLPVGSSAAADRPGHAPIHIRTAYEVNPYYEMEEPGNPPRVRTTADPQELAAAVDAIRKLRPNVDFLVASIHWGFGSGADLAEYQRPLGHALIDAGADAVIGHHVHWIHAVEAYKGRAILYSSAGFIQQQPREGQPELVVSLLDQMSPDGYAARFEVSGSHTSLELIPIQTDKEGLPRLARGEAFDRIAGRLESLSATLGTAVRRQGDRLVVELR